MSIKISDSLIEIAKEAYELTKYVTIETAKVIAQILENINNLCIETKCLTTKVMINTKKTIKDSLYKSYKKLNTLSNKTEKYSKKLSNL